MHRAQLRRLAGGHDAGKPGEIGEPYGDARLGGHGPWDRWRFDGFLMHAQYAPDGDHLRRITLTPLHE